MPGGDLRGVPEWRGEKNIRSRAGGAADIVTSSSMSAMSVSIRGRSPAAMSMARRSIDSVASSSVCAGSRRRRPSRAQVLELGR